ncbi:terminase-like family protein [Vibrio phage 1.084.O._10N.261.49.F5]|nr:terminase-like family protein [Vibrio phage 1.084.O._10N.261.49.F5]
MSKYWDKFPKIKTLNLNLKPLYGAGELKITPQLGPQQAFFSCMGGLSGEERRDQDFPLIFYGGAAGGGKSWSLLADALKYIDCPDFYAVFFRKTVKQLRRTLWKEAKKMFLPLLMKDGKFIGKANIKEQDMIIRFPTGATLEFSYLDRDSDAEMNWQGAELTAAYFDEFTHFSEYVFNYVRTRMRSDSKYESFIRAGMNPHPNHFVHKYLDIFIDQETGFAIKEYSGRPAYYIVDKGAVVTSFDLDELRSRYPDKSPRKYTMIPSSLEDNSHMLAKNSDYRDVLEANDPANAAMLLSGNWKYTPSANGIFCRENITNSKIILRKDLPRGCNFYRAWDKASSVPATEGGDSKTLDPDYTASVLFAKDSAGIVYVMGDYIRDSEQSQLHRFRQKPHKRDETILLQAMKDKELYGERIYQVMPRDPGQAGEVEQSQAMRVLANQGVKCLKDPSHGNKSKEIRFEPFCVATYTDNVLWVKDTFDIAVWDYILLELENFNPLLKNNGFHDEFPDVFSSAWAATLTAKVRRKISAGNASSTKLSEFRGKN